MTAGRPGTPGVGWERELVRYAEIHVPEDEGAPFGWDEPGERETRPNRAARRAAKRRDRPGVPEAPPRPSSENPYSETRPS